MGTRVIFLLALLFPSTVAAQQKEIRILFPIFESRLAVEKTPGTIGKRTTTILALQVWQTLRKPPSLAQRDVRRGGIYWDFGATPTTFEEAERAARNQDIEVQLVLWGRAFQYGDGIVVDSNLSIRRDGTGGEYGTNIWTASFAKGQNLYSISVDIPEWRYEFAPIVLKQELLPEINEAGQLKLYERRDRNKVIGDLSNYNFRALQHEGEYSLVKSDGKVGYIHLPRLSNTSSQVVFFCGGVIRTFRKDWAGALKLFAEMADSGDTPTAVRASAYLFMAIAAEKLARSSDSLSYIEQAYRLNPYSATTTVYLCMSHLARLSRLYPGQIGGNKAQQSIRAVRDLLSKNKVLFADNDSWLKRAEQFLEKMTNR